MCGLGQQGAWKLVVLIQPILLGIAAAASAAPLPELLAGMLPSSGGSGFLDSSWSFGRAALAPAVTMALPFAVYPFAAGATSRWALITPSGSTIALTGLFVAASVALVGFGTGVSDPRALGAMAASALLGATLGPPFLGWIAPEWARTLERRSRQSTLLRTIVALPIAHTLVLLLLAAYAAVLFAIWLACVLTLLVVAFKIVLRVAFGSSGGHATSSTEDWDGTVHQTERQDGELVRTSERKTGLLGGESVVQRDAEGRVTSVSTKKTSWFGDPYWEQRDADGKLISTAQAESDWFTGETRNVIRGSDGTVVARQAVEQSWFGDKALVTRGADEEIVAREYARDGWLGDREVVTEDRSGQIVGTRRADPALFDPHRVVHEGKSAADLLAERDERKDDA